MKAVQIQPNAYLNLDTVERIILHDTCVSLQTRGGNTFDVYDPYRDAIIKALTLPTPPKRTTTRPPTS